MMKRERPPFTLYAKLATAYRQVDDLTFQQASTRADDALQRRRGGKVLADLLTRLRVKLGGAEGEPLHLDHNPALRLRPYDPDVMDVAARYTPNANDPEYLIWRLESDHIIKTQRRGDGAQHPDRVLIKRERKFERGDEPKRPKVKIKSANRWPPRGSQKIKSRGFGLSKRRST